MLSQETVKKNKVSLFFFVKQKKLKANALSF